MLHLLLLIFSSFSIQASAFEQFVLAPGRFTEIAAHGGVPVTVSGGSVVRVSDRGRAIRITAKKVGVSEIRIGSRTLRVAVLPEPSASLHERLAEVVGASRGLELNVENKEIWIRGRLLRWEDWIRLSEVANESTAGYRFGATLEPALQEKAFREFRDKLRKASLPDTTLDLRPTASALVPTTPIELPKRIAEVLGPFGFSVQASSTALSLEPMVRVRIVVAEITKSRSLQYGMTWPSSISAQLLPTLALPGAVSTLDLSALEDKGIGRILASPTLLCRSGKEASFVAGGEVPIKVVSRQKNDVIWKQYGVILRIKPLADYSGKMSIALETEVSALDKEGAVDGVPSVHTNRIESHFDLTSSRTIALSGLIKSDQNENSGGIPGLGSLPVLGPLFSSKGFRERKTELVVFVTPDIAKEGEM